MYTSILFVSSILYFSHTNGYLVHNNVGRLRKLLDEFPVDQTRLAAVETKWIQQRLDHFNSSDQRTWNMRYFQNLAHFRNGGPLYLYLGGENEASEGDVLSLIADDLAVETHGVVFGSEHRYYGKSIPLDITITANLKFLSARQALEDAAQLLKYLKSMAEFKSSKVVVMGGSYAGNLAAWMRLLYPDLVDAAISSSGPVKAQANFSGYLEVVSDDFKRYGTSGCSESIAKEFRRYDTLMKTDQGRQQLKQEQGICNHTDWSLKENRQYFFYAKVMEYAYLVQNGNLQDIKKECYDRGVVSYNSCADWSFDKLLQEWKNSPIFISWTYQTCTEFGYFQTLESNNQLFTKNLPVDFYYKMCSDIYGPEFNEQRVHAGVTATNKMFGGQTLNVSRVVFMNGEMDPWKTLGVLKDLSPDAPARVIPRVSHCRDLFKSSYNDNKEVKEAKEFSKRMIKKWIGF